MTVHTADPAVQQIAERVIRGWLDTQTALALAAAGSGELSDYERGVRDGISRMRHLYLDNYWYTVVLKLSRVGIPPAEACACVRLAELTRAVVDGPVRFRGDDV